MPAQTTNPSPQDLGREGPVCPFVLVDEASR
jgi:hypothetical protein